MVDFVVDTNVLAFVDEPREDMTEEEIPCVEACLEWLTGFDMAGPDRVVIDHDYRILTEYRTYTNRRPGGFAHNWLNQLMSNFGTSIDPVAIQFDDNGYAILPDSLPFDDMADRKFIAVTLKHSPMPSIINATDTDWSKQKAMLEANGIDVVELCPDYIAEKLAGKS
ncbi:MAG: hypothetical protein AAF787_08195 [Chloroflexota bacterium]